MVKLTTAKAAHHLRYAEREIALGRGTPRLVEIAEHRRAYLRRLNACSDCGTVQTNPESIRLLQDDGLGSECRKRLAVAS